MLGVFWRDERGGMLLAFGFALLVLGLSGGLAMDFARVYSADRRTQFALDSAALAGARLLNEGSASADEIQAVALAAFQMNVTGISKSTATYSGFTIVPDLSNSTVSATVNVQVPATLARLAGIQNFGVVRNAVTSYNLARMEIVLAVDVTGSMNETPAGDIQPKLAALKSAASDIVNRLFDDATTDTNVRISLVPWSSGVNAGSYYSIATGSSPGWGSTCVVERMGDAATSDVAPSPLAWALPLADSYVAMGYSCPSEPVMPLKGRLDRTAIQGKIQNLTAAGGTAGHIGMAWAWHMLSENWAVYFPIASRPLPPSSNVIKAVILMTDGIFNTSFVGGTLSSGTGGYNADSYAMLQTICDGMQGQGIRVYTVAFDLTDATAVDKLAQCAGNPGNSFVAASSAQLGETFRTIVAELNSIRLLR